MNHVPLQDLQQFILDYVTVMPVVRILEHLVSLIKDNDKVAHFILRHPIEQISDLCIALPARARQRGSIVDHYVRI